MATKVHMEALSPTMEEGQLVRWLKKEGDTVKDGDVLAEIETDKATMELVARGSGVLQGVRIEEGQTAPVGEVIAMIAEEGEEVEAEGEAEAKAKPEAEPEAEPKAEPEAEPEGEAEREVEPEPEARKPAPSGAGQKAEAREPRGAGADADRQERGTRREQDSGERVKASPLARRLAEESGVELSLVEGTGPGGRITKADIEAAVKQGGAAVGGNGGRAADAGEAVKAKDAKAGEAADRAAPAPAAAAAGTAGPDSEEVPVTQMRKAIAKRLVQSIGPIPTFYLTIECDMSRLMELRTRTNRLLEKDGVKASINDFVIKVIASALAQHPDVNASWGDNVIVRHHRVHVGVAVAVEDGLITPIVRDADRKRVRDIAVEVRELAGRAREKKLKPDEYTGATFSVSNLGMFGIVEFTAIINPPEGGILAIGAVEDKPVVVDGEVTVQPRMRMTMSCDHRVIDGATGAKFLQTVREMIEDPMTMLA